MRLSAQLVFSLTLAIAIVIGIYGASRIEREQSLFMDQMRRNAHVVAVAINDFVDQTWEREGEARALEEIEGANEAREVMTIRWVWLDAPPGDAFAPAIPPTLLDDARKGHEVSDVIRDASGHGHLYTYLPVRVPDVRLGALELSESLDQMDAYVSSSVLRTVLILATVIMLSGLAASGLGYMFVAMPLTKLMAKTRRIAAGKLDEPVFVRGHNELSALAEAMNAMCSELGLAQQRIEAETAARLDALEQLRHADRLKTIGRLASGVAHELGTPLNVVDGRAALIAAGRLDEEMIRQNATIIKDQVKRMTRIIQQLLDFARRRPSQKALTDIRVLIQDTLDLLGPMMEKRQIRLEKRIGSEPLRLQCDVALIQQVFTNLIENALHATPEGGRLRVETGRRVRQAPAPDSGPDRSYAYIVIEDNGVGIAEEHVHHIFEPFFTTKDVGEGTGLGLSIVFGIVQEHSGWIDVESEPGRGSTFTVYLPEDNG